MIPLVRRNLSFFWRQHLWVVLGATVAAAVLIGALLVGDSVRLSLRAHALNRIGAVDAALVAHERFFRADLSTRLQPDLGDAKFATALRLQATAKNQAAQDVGRAGIVSVLGVDDGFFALAPEASERVAPKRGKAYLNERLARQLGVAVGGDVLLRVEKPSVLPREMAMATVDDVSFALPVEVTAILSDAEFGRFGLRAGQVPPFNVFVSLPWLQKELELEGKANLLLAAGGASEASELTAAANAAFAKRFVLADAEAKLRPVPKLDLVELVSDRVFLDPALGVAAKASGVRRLEVLTYFVKAIRNGEKTIPYSMVASAGVAGDPQAGALPLANLPDDGLVLNQWAADDLGAKVGDSITIDYLVLGDQLKLEQRSRAFAVRKIVPIAGAEGDPTLMPAFPGLHDSEHCRDWETGFHIDLEKIRDKDEKYWEQHRGTPKAFLGIEAGTAMWANRYGSYTSFRVAKADGETFAQELAKRVDPKGLGLFFRDVRTPAVLSGTSATDFGGLFLGLSFFLIAAGLMLTVLLNVFGIEQRAAEIGTLLAVGFAPQRVRRIFLGEAAVIATVGAVLGSGLGIVYTRAVLHGLDTLWRGAVGATSLSFHVQPVTLLMGIAIAIVVALLAIFFSLRRIFDLPAVALLASRNGIPRSDKESRVGGVSLALAIGAPVAAVGLGWFAGTQAEQIAGAFFGAGALLLIGGLAWSRRLLVRVARADGLASVAGLSVRNSGRRTGRSLLTVALLASGTFLVVAVQANRLEPPRDPSRRDAGTGGFAWFGRTTLPVLRDLSTAEGQDAFALTPEQLEGVGIVPLRVHEGDDASCLNLAQAQLPTLLGVDPELLASRKAFSFAGSLDAKGESPWTLLADTSAGPDVVPAIGDAASITWALHKSVGDELNYRDERGNEFRIKIVAAVQDSILQGNLLIADRQLRSRFPGVTGHRMFLIDTPADKAADVAKVLTRGLEDIGLELTPTSERLASFQAVQNTYLVIFQLLGGLGLLLGSFGVGMVVLRNALERRSELAVLSAIGYSAQAVRKLIFTEHSLLIALGMGTGVAAALLAILPGSGPVSWQPFLLVVAGITVSGLLFVFLASAIATRGALLDALRGE